MLFKLYGTVYGTLEALRKRNLQPVLERRTPALPRGVFEFRKRSDGLDSSSTPPSNVSRPSMVGLGGAFLYPSGRTKHLRTSRLGSDLWEETPLAAPSRSAFLLRSGFSSDTFVIAIRTIPLSQSQVAW